MKNSIANAYMGQKAAAKMAESNSRKSASKLSLLSVVLISRAISA